MNGKRFVLSLLIFSLLFSVMVVLANPGNVRGQMTIPTRTPVPDDNSPTDTPGDGNGGGDNGSGDNDGGDTGGDNGGNTGSGGEQAPATNTPVVLNTVAPTPSATATSVQASATATSVQASATATATNVAQPPLPSSTSSAVPTDDDALPLTDAGTDALAPGSTPVTFPSVASAFPTAGPCGEPPTFTTLTKANVYLGPGSDYPASDTLGAKEVRPIVGRAAYATWWLIQLDGKFSQGWISDKAGTVQGYTGNVLVIVAPAINGTFPTPGSEWDPTPAPACLPTPTPTGESAVVSGIVAYGDGAVNAQSAESAEAPSSSAQGSEIENVSSEQRSQIAEAARPLEVPSTTTPTPNLLPIAGLVLVIAAIIVALFLRRSSSRSGPST